MTNTFTTPVDFPPFLDLNIFAPGNSQEVKWNYQKKDFKWLKILKEFNADLSGNFVSFTNIFSDGIILEQELDLFCSLLEWKSNKYKLMNDEPRDYHTKMKSFRYRKTNIMQYHLHV